MKRAAFFFLCLLLAAGFAIPRRAAASPGPEYIFPRPGSQMAPVDTTIGVRYGLAIDPASVGAAVFTVQGAESGLHTGSAALADDGQTVVFAPLRPFTRGETVSVQVAGLRSASGSALEALTFTFETAGRPAPRDPARAWEEDLPENDQPELEATPARAAPPNLMGPMANSLTLPADFPAWTVDVAAIGTERGYVFLAMRDIPAPFNNPFLILMDDSGEPVWYYDFPSGQAGSNLTLQPNGIMTYHLMPDGRYYGLNSNYETVGPWAPVGYTADSHEFLLLPNNHKVFMIYDRQIIDMRAYGGKEDAEVTGLVIQETDRDNRVVFQWDSWDYIPFTDSYASLTGSRVDYLHGNAIDLDWDGNFLVSSRHACEITKIDRRTGEIIWRLGGKRNNFTATNISDPQGFFCYQHDIRRLPNGNLTMFDNRNTFSPSYSRAVEFSIDEDLRRVTQRWQYRSTGDLYSQAMGSTQRLPYGNTLIGWGWSNTVDHPTFTEVRPDGTIAMQVSFLDGQRSYRALRFPWVGQPDTLPDIAFRSEPGQVRVGYSWNGATEVASWRLYGAASREEYPNLPVIDEQARLGFETQSIFPSGGYCLFQVAAVDSNGEEMARSKVIWTNPNCAPWVIFLPDVRAE